MNGPRVRLDRLLANLGYGSRKQVTALVRSGQVRLDGASLTKSDSQILVSPELRTRLTVQGQKLDPLPGLNLLMHKPAGYSCSHRELGALVYELLPERWRARNPAITTVGRLDKETSGLLLLTENGTLVHQITSPKKAIPKTYEVKLARDLAGHEAALFQSGTLILEGESDPLLPAQLEVQGPCAATLIICEGRYHQVRRMFAATGNHVEGLHRSRIGNLALPADLAPGSFRELTEAELAKVFL